MIAAMKLIVTWQVFSKQLLPDTKTWEADDISSFLYRIWDEPLNCVNDIMNSTVNLIMKNVSTALYSSVLFAGIIEQILEFTKIKRLCIFHLPSYFELYFV